MTRTARVDEVMPLLDNLEDYLKNQIKSYLLTAPGYEGLIDLIELYTEGDTQALADIEEILDEWSFMRRRKVVLNDEE